MFFTDQLNHSNIIFIGIVSAAIGVGLILGPSTIGYFGRTNFYIGLGIGLSCTFLALCGMYFVKESLHYLKEESEIIVEKPFVCAPYANPFRCFIIFILFCLFCFICVILWRCLIISYCL